MADPIEFHLKGEDNRALLIDWDGELMHLSLHIRGGHLYMNMTKEQSQLLIEAIEAIKQAQEGP